MLRLLDAFDRGWRDRLSQSLARVLGTDVHPDEAAQLLATLDARYFAALDQRIRLRTWERGGSRRISSLAGTGPVQHRAAYLFAAACDANGFMREQALIAFRTKPSRLALVAALLRCDDWVAPVAATARDVLTHLLENTHGEELFALLDLLLSLKERQRFEQQAWPLVERVLLDPVYAQQRWRASTAGTTRARLLALELIVRCEPDATAAACRAALDSPDPVLARWALAQAARIGDADFCVDLAARGLRHPSGSVRTAALRLVAECDPTGAKARIEEALFDPARAPRSAAAYELRTRYALDARDRWRRALDTDSDEHDADVALDALAENAQPCDAARFLKRRDDPRPKIRAAALLGLQRAQSAQFPEQFAVGLHDPSARVVRACLLLARQQAGLLDVGLLTSAFDSAPDARVRRALVRATRLLGKWPALLLYVRWAPRADPAVREELRKELRRWQASAARQFTMPEPHVKSEIEEKLHDLQPIAPPALLADLRHALAHV